MLSLENLTKLAVIVAIVKFLLEGVYGHADSATYGMFLAPIIAGHVGHTYFNSPDQK